MTTSPATLNTLRFMVVDGRREFRDVLRYVLGVFGTEDVYECESGLAACRCLPIVRPDFLLSSMRPLPLDGIDLTRHVRGLRGSALAFMPVTLFDDEPTLESVTEAMAAGADDFVRLPISTAEFGRRLARVLRRRQRQRAPIDCRSEFGTARQVVRPPEWRRIEHRDCRVGRGAGRASRGLVGRYDPEPSMRGWHFDTRA